MMSYSRPLNVVEYEKKLSKLSDMELDMEAKRAIKDPSIYWKSPLLHSEYQRRGRDIKKVIGDW